MPFCEDISYFIYAMMSHNIVLELDTVIYSHWNSNYNSYFQTDSLSEEQFNVLDTIPYSVLSKYKFTNTLSIDSVVFLYQFGNPNQNINITILGKAGVLNESILSNRMEAVLSKFELQWGF